MTRVNSPEPPRLATWLLEQFSPVLKNAPLAGDLIEAFKQGRSSRWYWTQVLGAILIALPTLLRKQQLWACLAYAAGCSGLISAFDRRGSSPLPLYALYAQGSGMQWPWSLVYQIAFVTAFEAVLVAFALAFYLALTGILRPRNFLRAVMVVLVALASINVALTFLSLWVSDGWVLSSMPTTVALLLGIWKANLGRTPQPMST